MNTIVNLKTVNLQSPDGPVTAIVMGLEIPEPQSADAFIREVAEKFKAQRMCSPPDTSIMVVTIVSEMPVSSFVSRWRQLEADDKVLEAFMSKMRRADVLRGTVAGQALETVSLLHEPSTDDIEMSEQFADLVFLALDHGVESVRDSGGPLIPFVVFEQDGELKIQRFATERMEEGPEQAREAIAASPESVTAYALAYDGYVTIEGTRCDAILVEASERGRPAGVRMAQRYAIKDSLESFQTVGNPALLGECETLLR